MPNEMTNPIMYNWTVNTFSTSLGFGAALVSLSNSRNRNAVIKEITIHTNSQKSSLLMMSFKTRVFYYCLF